jgi:hypothetical protein
MSAWLGLLALCGALVAAAVPARAQESDGWDRYLGRPRGPYRGQVVDAETKAPLAGAVVVARWMRDRIAPLHLMSEHHAVREVVTDSEGRFVLEATDVEVGAPRHIHHPEFLIFIPGYGSYPRKHVSPKGFTGGIFEGSGTVVELPRLTDRMERRNELRLFDPHSFSAKPFKELPEFVSSFNEERIALGLEPLSPLE